MNFNLAEGNTLSLSPAERLIVSPDYDPRENGGVFGVSSKILELIKRLEGTGVTIKGNSILRASGYSFINVVHNHGLKFFADLKLNDIPTTMKYDAAFLADYKPDFVTVMANAGVDGIRAVVNILDPLGCEVLAVTVLTSLNDDTCEEIYKSPSKDSFERLAGIANRGGANGLILSSLELPSAFSNYGSHFTLNVPGIRSKGKDVKEDDQHRMGTPYGAIKAGATRLVVGREVTQAENPYDAVMRIIDEITRAEKDKENFLNRKA